MTLKPQQINKFTTNIFSAKPKAKLTVRHIDQNKFEAACEIQSFPPASTFGIRSLKEGMIYRVQPHILNEVLRAPQYGRCYRKCFNFLRWPRHPRI